MSPDVTIAVLAFDEADNLPRMLAELRGFVVGAGINAEIIVIDDGSNDNTSEVARQCLNLDQDRVVRHPTNLGMGAGLKTAVRAAKSPWVTFLPADGQIEPAAVGTLLHTATTEGCDLVLSTYQARHDGLARAVMSRGLRALIVATHRVHLASEGPYLFRRSLFNADRLQSDTFFLNFEFPIHAIGAGAKVGHVRIRCRPRISGVSKSAKWSVIARVAYELIRLRWSRRNAADAAPSSDG